MADKDKVTVTVSAVIPEAKLAAYLQHIRDFEREIPDEAHIGISVNAPGLSADEVKDILKSVTPTFPFLADVRLS